MTMVIEAIFIVTQILTFAILGRVILSWVMQMNPTSTFLLSAYRVLVQFTDPILAPIRRVVPPAGMFDLTPMVAIILLWLISEVLSTIIRQVS
ncbi:MAG: YggT family protein [Dehalococcoidia bacterium]